MNLPQRQTLTKQTVDALLQGLRDGVWKETLPGERELCRYLQVSRPTLRAALEILHRGGNIAVAQGKRSAILKRNRHKSSSDVRTVALISKIPLYSMSRNRIYLINYLNQTLQERDLRLAIVSHPAFGSNNPRRAIQYLRERGDFRAFILTLSSHAIQKWFCDNSLPSIVLGSTFPGLTQPAIDSDYPSIGRYAAGVLLGKFHRRIAFIIPESNYAGDLETQENFLQSLKAANFNLADCRIIRHGLTSSDLIQKIRPLIDSSQPPTAFFVLNTFATTTLVTYLLSRGWRLPENFSLISRDYDPLLEWISPKVAHFIFPLRRIGSKISRMVIELASNGVLPPHNIRIMPEFCKAESLAVAPRNKKTPADS